MDEMSDPLDWSWQLSEESDKAYMGSCPLGNALLVWEPDRWTVLVMPGPAPSAIQDRWHIYSAKRFEEAVAEAQEWAEWKLKTWHRKNVPDPDEEDTEEVERPPKSFWDNLESKMDQVFGKADRLFNKFFG